MIRTYKYKLYNTKRIKYLNQRVDIAGIIYNHCIALHKRYYKLFGKSLNKFQLQKHLTKLKKLPRYSLWNGLRLAINQQPLFSCAFELVRSTLFEKARIPHLQSWGVCQLKRDY